MRGRDGQNMTVGAELTPGLGAEAVGATLSQDKPGRSPGASLAGADPPQHRGLALPRGRCAVPAVPRRVLRCHVPSAQRRSSASTARPDVATASSLSHPHPPPAPSLHPFLIPIPIHCQPPSSHVPAAATPAWELLPKCVCMFFKANTLWLGQHHPTGGPGPLIHPNPVHIEEHPWDLLRAASVLPSATPCWGSVLCPPFLPQPRCCG